MMLNIRIELNDDGSIYIFDHGQPEALDWCKKHGKKLIIVLENAGEAEAADDPVVCELRESDVRWR